jgi:hypothetical protein
MAFCRDILEPYEKIFPRRKEKGEEGEEEKKKNENSNYKDDKTDSIMPLLVLL